MINIEVDTIINNAIFVESIVYTKPQSIIIVVEHTDQYITTDHSKSIYYFIEGQPDAYNKEITITDLERYISEKKILSKNEDILNIRNSRYLISNSTGYRKIIDNKTSMKRGYIECVPYMKQCEVDISNIYFKCFRSEDGMFIGEYPVVDGISFIPNLDCNSEYDIIFVDKTKTLEHIVQSRRKPKEYIDNTKIILHKLINITTEEDESIEIRWNYDLIDGAKFGNIKIYYSNEYIDTSKLSEYKYIFPNNKLYANTDYIKSNYLIEHRIDDTVDYYRVNHNNFAPRNLTSTIEYEPFRSSPLSLKYTLEYDEED